MFLVILNGRVRARHSNGLRVENLVRRLQRLRGAVVRVDWAW